MSDSKKVFKVLSIDGGGIRGIIPAVILKKIEEKTGKRISHLFDLIAGVSTGGIIALSLTMPESNSNPSNSDGKPEPEHTAEDLVNLYKDKGERIFDQSLIRWIASGNGWLDQRYSSSGIEKVLKHHFKHTSLKDAITPVLIPSYDMQGTRRYWKAEEGDPFKTDPRKDQGGCPRFFKSSKAKKLSYENYLMRDVARATSAAPTYFEPHKTEFNVPEDQELSETLVDGGIFANNPAMCAYAEAKKICPNADILLVSLGTGELMRKLKHEEAEGWGKARWVEPLLRMIFDGASATVDYQLQQLLHGKKCSDEEGKKLYYRFQPALTKGLDEMDNVFRTNLDALEELANDHIKKNKSDLKKLCKQLKPDESNDS